MYSGDSHELCIERFDRCGAIGRSLRVRPRTSPHAAGFRYMSVIWPNEGLERLSQDRA